MQQVTSIKQIELKNKNKDNVIVMNIEEYTNSIFDEETVKSLLKSEEDIEKGRTRNATEVIKEFKEKYGF